MAAPDAPSALQLLGFALAAWAVIGNDALQTLGPFLAANRDRTPRLWQGLYLGGLLAAVLLPGWLLHGGDASWGRLAQYPLPPQFSWPVLLAPLAVLLLTQLGVPVSTSFLVLTAFRPSNLPALLRQSLLGYGVALLVGLGVYGALAAIAVRRQGDQPQILRQEALEPDRAGVGSAALDFAAPDALALLLQWLATGWLWGQWLVQDMANIYIYLPRRLGPGAMAFSLVLLCGGIALLLLERGGAIQAILRRKHDLETPGATASLSLVYGLVLCGFALFSRQPMSTTWVFLGLLAGREFALLLEPQRQSWPAVLIDLGRDLLLAALGLAVSLAVAMAVQPLAGLG